MISTNNTNFSQCAVLEQASQLLIDLFWIKRKRVDKTTYVSKVEVGTR